MAAQGFFTPDEMATPDDIEYRKKLAQSLMGQGMSAEPIKHWTQGAARLAQALVGAGWQEQARADQRGNSSAYVDALKGMIPGLTPDATPAAATPAPTAPKPATTANAMPQGGVGNFDSSVNRLFGFEGGLNPKDTNGTPSNMGINQKWNPNVDVANLTRDQAREIYRNNYWNAIGGDNLPPALAHVAFDTAAMSGPAKAKALMAEAGNDPVKMLELRQQFLNNLVAQNPEKYGPYAKAWANRTEGLRGDVLAYAPTDGAPSAPAPQAIASALTGNPQPAPVQVAQATPSASAPSAMPAAATQSQMMQQRLMGIISDPRFSQQQKAQALQMFSLMKKDDPVYQKLNDGTLFNPKTGETKGVGSGYKMLVDPAERARYGIDPADKRPYQLGPDGKLNGVGGSTTNINTSPGPAKNVYDTVEKRADEARAAAQSLPAFAEAKRLVDSGQITLGAGADMRLSMQKIGALFGMDATSASNAETFRSSVAPIVFSLTKNLGSGSGISNNDLAFAEKAAGGNITLEPATIKRLLDIGVKAAQYKVDSHNKMLDKVYPDGVEDNRQVRSLFQVEVPPYSPPADPAGIRQ